jgi:hypothetical protein
VAALSDEGLAQLNDTFPYDGQARDAAGYEGLFYDRPDLEGTFCRLLGLDSESEKMTRAALDSAAASRISAQAALDSARWARIAGIVSLLALAASVIGLLKG